MNVCRNIHGVQTIIPNETGDWIFFLLRHQQDIFLSYYPITTGCLNNKVPNTRDFMLQEECCSVTSNTYFICMNLTCKQIVCCKLMKCENKLYLAFCFHVVFAQCSKMWPNLTCILIFQQNLLHLFQNIKDFTKGILNPVGRFTLDYPNCDHSESFPLVPQNLHVLSGVNRFSWQSGLPSSTSLKLIFNAVLLQHFHTEGV